MNFSCGIPRFLFFQIHNVLARARHKFSHFLILSLGLPRFSTARSGSLFGFSSPLEQLINAAVTHKEVLELSFQLPLIFRTPLLCNYIYSQAVCPLLVCLYSFFIQFTDGLLFHHPLNICNILFPIIETFWFWLVILFLTFIPLHSTCSISYVSFFWRSGGVLEKRAKNMEPQTMPVFFRRCNLGAAIFGPIKKGLYELTQPLLWLEGQYILCTDYFRLSVRALNISWCTSYFPSKLHCRWSSCPVLWKFLQGWMFHDFSGSVLAAPLTLIECFNLTSSILGAALNISSISTSAELMWNDTV